MKNKPSYQGQKKVAKKSSPVSAKEKQQTSRKAINGKKNYWYIAIILFVGFLVYIPALKAGFVNWDDPDYVQDYPFIKDLWNLKGMIMTSVQGNYHPLTMFSLALNYQISQFDGWSYHLLNILLHLVNTYLVFQLAMLLSKRNLIIAFTTSILFAIHPLHVESVAWVTERKDVLYSLFFIAGLISYTKYVDTNSRKQYLFTFLFLVLSLLSKPAAVVFPVLLFGIDYLRKRELNYKIFVDKILLFIPAIAMAVITYAAQKEKGATGGTEVFDLGTRMFMGFYGILIYFLKMIGPFGLSAFYPFPPLHETLPSIYYVSPLFFIALMILVIATFKKNRVYSFGIFFYLINLVLVLQFLPVGSAVIAERYTYLPYIGLFYIGGWLLSRWAKDNFTRSLYILVPVCIFFGIITFMQASVWISSESLWDQAIKNQPSSRAYDNRAKLFKDEKKYDEAIAYYTQSLSLNAIDHEGYTNRGNAYFEQGKYDLAYQDYQKAISIKSNYPAALDNMGALMGLRSKYDSALYYLNGALTADSTYRPAFRNRGLVYLSLNRNQDALKDFLKFLEKDKQDADMLNIIGMCYRLLGNYQESLDYINKAISIRQDPHFILNRAYCYKAMGNLEQAKKDALAAKQQGLILEDAFAKSLGIQ